MGFATLTYCCCLFLNDKTLSGKVTQNRVKYVPIVWSNAYLTACVVEPNEGERNHLGTGGMSWFRRRCYFLELTARIRALSHLGAEVFIQ